MATQLLTSQDERNKFVEELFATLEVAMNGVIYDGEELSLNKGICFTASKVACKILRRLGYSCEVQRVKYIIGNEGGIKKFNQFLKDGKKPNYVGKEHILGLGFDEDDKTGEAGNHYVVYFDKEDLILDLTIGQASRPEKDIVMKPYFSDAKNKPKEIIGCKFQKPDKEYELSTSFYLGREGYEKIIQDTYKRLKGRWKK